MPSVARSFVSFAVFVLAALALPAAASADSDSTLTVTPVGLTDGITRLEFETAPIPFLSLWGAFNARLFAAPFEPEGGESTYLFGPEVGARVFPFGAAPSGLWIGPLVGAGYTRVEGATRTEEGASFWAGGMIGGTLILFDIITLSAGVGAIRYGLDFEDESNTAEALEPTLDGWTPRVRLAVGIAF